MAPDECPRCGGRAFRHGSADDTFVCAGCGLTAQVQQLRGSSGRAPLPRMAAALEITHAGAEGTLVAYGLASWPGRQELSGSSWSLGQLTSVTLAHHDGGGRAVTVETCLHGASSPSQDELVWSARRALLRGAQLPDSGAWSVDVGLVDGTPHDFEYLEGDDGLWLALVVVPDALIFDLSRPLASFRIRAGPGRDPDRSGASEP